MKTMFHLGQTEHIAQKTAMFRSPKFLHTAIDTAGMGSSIAAATTLT
jgi:hypothetical protein